MTVVVLVTIDLFLHILPRARTQSHRRARMRRVAERMLLAQGVRMRVGKGSRWKIGVRVRHAPNWSDKSARNQPQPALKPRPGFVRSRAKK